MLDTPYPVLLEPDWASEEPSRRGDEHDSDYEDEDERASRGDVMGTYPVLFPLAL
jgi:hypothetical protein